MLQQHHIIFMPSGRRGHVPAGHSLLDAARSLGVEIESICGGRLTCGKCKVQIEEGQFAKHGITSSVSHLTPAAADEKELLARSSSSELSSEERSLGTVHRLSCVSCVQGDLLVFVPEESRAHKQIIRKTAVSRLIEINPAIRKLYVEVDQAELGEHRGDWGRLQDAVEKFRASSFKFQLSSSEFQVKEPETLNLQPETLKIDLPVLRHLQSTLRKGDWKVTVTLWQEREVIDVQPGYVEGIYGLAVDIGSTTIAGFLCDLRTGAILATDSTMNPQVTYGEDLMSRISYAMTNPNGLDKMHEAIIEALNKLAARAAKEAGIRPRDIHEAVFVGNTTMMHILLGINPIELGGAPFALANRDAMDIKARELGLRLHPCANVHILPAEAGHVGADNVAVLIAEEPYNQDEVVLTVDVGTNAEIVLGNRERLYSASSPTGPAFEGAQIAYGMRAAPGAIERVRIDPESKIARFRVIGEEKWSDEWQLGGGVPVEAQPRHLAAGICGSGIIEVVAEMFLAGILLPDGRFNPVDSEQYSMISWEGKKGVYVLATAEQSATGKPILVTQDDVRNIQLAKAALYAGAKLLMNQAGITAVDRIVLAGAFGSYIDPQYAMILGLIPNCDLNKVYAVGNAAGDGARIALLNKAKRVEAQQIARWVRYVETAVDPDFQQEFVAAIHIPHATDPFPELTERLPQKTAVSVPNRERRRRK